MDLDPSSALEANIREFCYQQLLSWTCCSLTLHALSVSIRADAQALQHLDIQALLAALDCLCQADHWPFLATTPRFSSSESTMEDITD